MFPYSDVPPSTEFVLATECTDERCDVCQEIDAVFPKILDIFNAPFKQCDSCYSYVNVLQGGIRQDENCDLCDSVTVEHCLNCDTTQPELCVSCEPDYYVASEGTECAACAVEVTEANGCARCSADTCLECLPGYYEADLEGNGQVTCLPCDLTEFNSQYTVSPNRCSQCHGLGVFGAN